MKFKIYRYNPETDEQPYMRNYELDIEAGDMMLLDALLLIREQDDSLSLRKSCREGVCGSDAMNINGRNG
ncbi:MAG: 2Fe-2S iron-sulfur cluster-binding protein, partial [Candidatus Nitrotoga sp.]